MQVGRRRASLLAIAMSIAFGHAPTAGAGGGISTFPACSPVLQTCVDAAGPGDTIIIQTDDADDQFVIIDKSMTLISGGGVRHTVGAIGIGDGGNVMPIDVTIEDLGAGLISALFTTVDGNQLTLSDVDVGKGALGAGVTVTTQRSASIVIERSSVQRHTGSDLEALGLFADPSGGDVSFSVVGNRISDHGNPESGAGIRLGMQGSGTVDADFYNNTIWDVARCNCGAASGLAILPEGLVRADVNVVGNTFERSRTNAIQQRNDLVPGGRLALDVFNNVFAHSRGSALSLETGGASTLAFRAGSNDFFATGGNALDGQSLGVGNLKRDPMFVDRSSGNFALQAGSPLIDRGVVCSPGGVADPDVRGRSRLAGAQVDLGAHERGAGAVNGIVRLGANGGDALTGSSGGDILCGFGGADDLSGRGGDDFLDGGLRGDLLAGGQGADDLYGSAGADTLCARDGASGNDRVDGGKGSDGFRADNGDRLRSVEHLGTCQA